MKTNKLFKFLFGISLPIMALSSSLCVANEKEIVEDKSWLLAEQELFDIPYPTKDYLNEPELESTFKTNFAPMGFGDTPNEAKIWDQYRGKDVTVAVIDSGLDIYHEDFLTPEAQGKILDKNNVEQYSIIDKRSAFICVDPNSSIYDPYVTIYPGILKVHDKGTYAPSIDRWISHGTCCASCIGAMINGVGGFGIAPNVNLLIIKSDLKIISCIKAIEYAIECGADIVSMSFGIFATYVPGHPYIQNANTAYVEVAKLAKENNVMLVAAAGNESTYEKSYPASTPNILGVGALEKYSKDKLAYFSNYNKLGTDTQFTFNNTDVVAPGYAWAACVNKNDPRLLDTTGIADHEYNEIAGTSFATPLTAGALALYKSKYPNSTYEETLNALYTSCEDIGFPGWDYINGHGRVDVPTLLEDKINATSVKVEKDVVNLVGSVETPFPTYQSKLIFAPANTSEANRRGVWISDNEKVCRVDEAKGTIVATGNGTAHVTFTSTLDKLTTTIEVNVSNVTPYNYETDDIKATLVKDRLLIGETTKINVEGYGPLLFKESDTKIIEIDKDGNIIGKGLGEFYIHIHLENYVLPVLHGYVTPDYELSSIEVIYDEGDMAKIKFGEQFKNNGYKVLAHYTNGEPDKIIQPTLDEVDIWKVGKNPVSIKYEEYGIVKTNVINFWNTFEGAVANKTTFKERNINTAHTDKNYFTGNGSIIKSTQYDGTWLGWQVDVTAQNEDSLVYKYDDLIVTSVIGSSTHHADSIKLTSIGTEYLTVNGLEIIITTDPGAIISVKVGDTSFTCDGQEKVETKQDLLEDLTFEGNAKGIITIEITNITSDLGIGPIITKFPEQIIDEWNPNDQVEKYTLSLKEYKSCASDWNEEARKEIPLIINEFNLMSQDAKNKLYKMDDFIDFGGYSTNPLNKLKMIVSQYNATLKKGETKLKLILSSDENNTINNIFDGDITENMHIDLLTIIILGSLSVALLGITTFVSYKKKQRR